MEEQNVEPAVPENKGPVIPEGYEIHTNPDGTWYVLPKQE